ncbi:DinB family protein [Flindersiella endophytica]
MLTGWLDWQRTTVRLKCEGLSPAGAGQAPLPSSPLTTIAGVVSHLRWVEHHWFEVSFLGEPHRTPSTAGDPDAEWRVDGSSLPALLDEYDKQCARSREIVAGHGLDELEAYAPPGIELVSLRWIVVHMIEETARHLGHLDALRELADETTGY